MTAASSARFSTSVTASRVYLRTVAGPLTAAITASSISSKRCSPGQPRVAAYRAAHSSLERVSMSTSGDSARRAPTVESALEMCWKGS